MDTSFAVVVGQVLSFYPFDAIKISLLSYKGKKAVWSIRTDFGEVIMKKVPFQEDDIAFMVHAIDYLRAGGIHTPGVIRTTSGAGFVKLEEEYFVIFEAVHGRSPEYENDQDLLAILRGLASFHRASSGIESPTGTFPSFLLTEWKDDLHRRAERMSEWIAMRAQETAATKFDRLFLQYADLFQAQCQRSISMLEQSCFEEWVEQTKAVKTLCHQDYAAGNLAIGDDGHLYVYDMDSLSVDLPVRDMRKILNKVMKKRTEWDLELMITMMQAYQEVNPLTKEQYAILAADAQFPHLFYGQVSKYYDKREEKWTIEKHVTRLEDMIATEVSKDKVLKLFLDRLDEVVKDVKS